MTMMKNPIVDQGQILRVNPIMNDQMNHYIAEMLNSANDNMRDNSCENNAINGISPNDSCALLTAFQKDLRQLNVYYAETILAGASYELHDDTFVIYPADASLTAQVKDILEAPLSYLVKQRYNKSVEIVMRE